MLGIASAENSQLQGFIIDESGKPVAGAELYLYDSIKTRRSADYISAKTGIDGRYLMKVPSGVYWAVARVRHNDKFGPLLSGDLHSGEPIEVNLSSGALDLAFTVTDIREASQAKGKSRSNVSKMTGIILDSSGQPAGKAAVYAWIAPMSERFPDVISSWTENNGEYSIYLLPGKYKLMASTSFPPALAEGKIVDLTVSDHQKDIVLNLQLIKIGTNQVNGPVSLPSDASSLDSE